MKITIDDGKVLPKEYLELAEAAIKSRKKRPTWGGTATLGAGEGVRCRANTADNGYNLIFEEAVGRYGLYMTFATGTATAEASE